MENKKEIQEKISKTKPKATEEEFTSIIKLLAPGTHLRSAIDGALKTKKGALIVVENENLTPLIDGGFRINSKFTPQKLIELIKMDGAIILSKDMKKINYANVLLTPNSKIKSLETGTRHKAAERTAKESETLVIAISERKNEINLYYKNKKYPIASTVNILRKANERIQLLEKQRELFDNHIKKLNILELRNYPSLEQAINLIQKGRLIQKISVGLQKYIIELGKEGTLLKIRLKELLKGIEKETDLVIKDYTQINLKRSKILLENLSYEEIHDSDHILKILSYESNPEVSIVKGWRILDKTCLLDSEIAEVIKEAGSLSKAIHSSPNFYKTILGHDKAVYLQDELRKIKMNASPY
jgi:diadenylate cyclase